MTSPVPERTFGDAAYRTLLPSEVTEMEEFPHGTVRCVIVTPERAVLDAITELVVLPMYDGELGVQAGRAPFVGQLAPGELRLRSGNAVARFFVDGGFAQVRGNVVNVLTPKAMVASDVTTAKAESAYADAEAITGDDAIARANRQRALARARGLAKVAAKG